MHFSNLAYLYLYGIIFFLIILYFFKGYKKRLEIPSLLPWRDLEKRSKSFRLNYRFRPDLLFFLQLLILLLLVTALLDPFFLNKGLRGEKVVLVLDVSASMQTRDVKPNRFQTAVKKASRYLGRFDENTEIALLVAGKRPEVVQSFTNNIKNIQKELSNVKVRDESLDFNKAIELARSLFAEGEEEKIIFFTDAVFSEDIRALKGVEVHKVGSKVDNIAFTDFKIHRKKLRQGSYEIYLEITNYAKDKKEINMLLTLDNRQYLKDKFIFSSGESIAETYTINVDKLTYLTAHLLEEDLLDIDNNVRAVLGTELEEDFRVLIVGNNNFFLQRGLLLIPGVRVFTEDAPGNIKDLSEYDLVIYTKDVSEKRRVKRALYLGVKPPGVIALKRNDELIAEASGWQKEHPVLRYLDLANLKVKSPLVIKMGKSEEYGYEEILNSSAGPLIFASNEGNYKSLFITFKLNNSNLPLQTNFPLFLFNVINWFRPQHTNPEYIHIQVGETIPLSFSGTELKVVDPEGSRSTMKLTDGKLYFSATREGIYRFITRGSREYYIIQNLTSSSESNLLNVYQGIDEVVQRKKAGVIRKELWSYIILVSLLFIIVEWLIYNKPVYWRDKNAS